MLCSAYNAVSARNYSQRYLVPRSISALTWLSRRFSHLWVHAYTLLPLMGPIATAAALPRSSAAPLPPITLLYMIASHLTWTARQLAATGTNAGPRGDAMSADADASFRRHVSICFPEGLLNAESMSPAEIAAAMLPHYNIWLRQARSAIGYPPTSQ